VLITLLYGVTTESVTHGQFMAKSTVTFSAFGRPILISRPAEGRKLSWREWLNTYDGIPVCSPS